MIPSVARLARVWTAAVRTTKAAAVLALLVAASVAALVVRAATLELPEELRATPGSESIRFVDREGRLLREVRADDATRARRVPLGEVSADLVHAVLAAEDRRFYSHPGVDALAVARAAWSDTVHARVVSGASTLTMQLARLVRPHRRTLLGKLDEAALALRIEASLPKQTVLEEYLNRAPFGGGIRGVDTASRYWFDKAPAELSLAEAATLAAIPRGPAVYALDRHPDRVLRRRDRILDRMVTAGWATREQAERARREPLAVRAGRGTLGAPHLVQALGQGTPGLWPVALGDSPHAAGVQRVETTLDADLQRELELATRELVGGLASRHVDAAGLVVLDNASGDVLAYVGSPDFDDPRGGQNDAVRARRQPGSTLKPFVYGLAMERLGWSPATLVPDLPLRVAVEDGVYAPMNYDERFHGPVRVREALGSSLNVPAVWTAEQVGIGDVLERLRDVGFTLDRSDAWYGPAIALGDGEVSLLELANAYAAIARGGTWRPVRAVRSVVRAGAGMPVEGGSERRVMSASAAAMLADVLADPGARVAAFGAESPLDFPYDVAAKTGTSKGSRDNWTVGFTTQVTVAVWVGNLDGSAMHGTSGITGAGPLFHAAMDAAMRGRQPGVLRLSDQGAAAAGLERVEVCPLSGRRAGGACPHRVSEWVTPQARETLEACDMHERVRVDRRNGLRAGPGCPVAEVVERTFERYDEASLSWATTTGRPVAPDRFSPLCPGALARVTPSLRIGWPADGARFVLDPERARAQQRVTVRVEAPSEVDRVELLVDGRPVARVGAPFLASWVVEPGEHVLVARAAGGVTSAPVSVAVE
jgi:penicillin-binding protein 1C